MRAMRRLKRLAPLTVAGSLVFGSAVDVQAQTDARRRIECVAPMETSESVCRAGVAAPDSVQTYLVRVHIDGLSQANKRLVRFVADSGRILPDTVSTDEGGFASARWSRTRGAGPVLITVSAGSGIEPRLIQLTPIPLEPTREISVVAYSGNRQNWFEKTPLRYPLVVELQQRDGGADKPIADRDLCESQRVVFTRVGNIGTILPDSAGPRLDSVKVKKGEKRAGCFALANWTMGDGVGFRYVRANLVSSSTSKPTGRAADFQALARGLPRLVGGLAVIRDREYQTVSAATKSIVHVEREVPGVGTVTFDSTVSSGRDTLKVQEAATTVAPIFGVSAAIAPRVRWLSVLGGVDVRNPEKDWYAGLSLLRVLGLLRVGGLYTEGLLVDVHVVSHWGRVERPRNAAACANNGKCATEKDAKFRGGGVLVSVDASSLLADVIKKIGS